MTNAEAIERLYGHNGNFEELCVCVPEDKEAVELAIQALKEKQERVNPQPLTIEELKYCVIPVWVVCKVTLEGGYWCLCDNGYITTPDGCCFRIEEIPNWNFYKHKPKEG